MTFGEKLKTLRKQAGWTQTEVADQLEVTLRTYQNYEMGRMYPRQSRLYGQIAQLFQVTVDYLLNEDELYVAQAVIRGGPTAKREVQALLSRLGGLFAGGELSEDDKDKVVKTINDLYWEAKENNKKYRSKKSSS